jgi:hypothetical protein
MDTLEVDRREVKKPIRGGEISRNSSTIRLVALLRPRLG